MRLGNREIADRCSLPGSTVSRLTLTLTRIGQLIYLPQEQKYALGPHALAFGAPLFAESCEKAACAESMNSKRARASLWREINSRFECFEVGATQLSSRFGDIISVPTRVRTNYSLKQERSKRRETHV